MRKSKTASSASAEFSSTSVSSSSSVPVSSSSSSSKNKSHSITGRSTTATINNTNTTTTTTTTTTGNNNSSSSSSGGCAINGTRGSRSNDNNVQSTGKQQQQQRSPLNRQFDVVTAPLATFDTVDLSDEEVTTPTATTTTITTNSPSSTANNNICRKKTASTNPTAARTQEIKTTHTSITDTSSCSNSSNVSAPSLRTSAANNTNSTTITTTNQNIIPAEISDRKSHVTCTLADLNSITAKATKKKNNIYESSGKKTTRTQTDSITSSAKKTNRVDKKSVPALSNQESIRVRSLPDEAKDSDVSLKQSRVTDSNVIPSSSSDDDEGTSHVATGLASVSPNKCKPDSVSVESTRPTIGEGSTVITAAGITAVAGATAGSVLSTANVDFANFGSTEDLNTNNIGGSQSIATDGGGLTAPAATGGGAVSKAKEVSAVEKASLLDESSSSDSDLSPTEPGPTGGAYTTLTSGSTPNLIRKISHDATSTIKESSGQPADFNSPEIIASSSKRKAYERRLQRLQVKTTPINRPRSTTPLSVVTLDEYTNLSSPEISPNLEKLKIVLPADQFGRPIKSPRSKENAFDFNEDRLFRHTKEAIVLQSDGSIGQSPRRIFIPPTLSPSQSPCKAAAGSPVSKLVLVSRLPAGTSPLVKSAAPSVFPPPPLLPPPTVTTTTTTTTTTTSSSSCSTSSSTSSIPPRKISDKQWEQFEESHSKTPQQQPQATCAIPKRSEHPVALPTFEKKQGLTRTGPPGTSCTVKGQKEQEKKKKKVFTGEDSTKPSIEQHTDLRRNTTSTLNPSHHKVQMNCPEEEEEEEILKVEIGSSEVGKAYNIELEVPAKEKLDSSHSKSSS